MEGKTGVCVCVCVREREREREGGGGGGGGGGERENTFLASYGLVYHDLSATAHKPYISLTDVLYRSC